jgi:hypothetical protein
LPRPWAARRQWEGNPTRSRYIVLLVNDGEQPSERLVQQRLRNRAMEALCTLSEGPDGVRAIGVVEFVEQFFDVIDDEVPWHWRSWTSFTPDEVEGIGKVLRLMNAACAATPRVDTEEEFISSGWPARIQPAAASVLERMQARGRFREDIVEDVPSLPGAEGDQ